MIARLLRGLWLAALVVAGAAAWASIRLFGAAIGPSAAALVGVLAVAALHPLAIACNFVLSRLAGDAVPAEHRLNWRRALLTYDAEIDASMRGVWFATPFLEARPTPRPPVGAPTRRHALLFIHGYLCNRAVWQSFMRDAASRGYVCEAITLDDPLGPIEGHADAVRRAIDRLVDDGADAAVIVGHSMGGLVARAALQRIDASRVARVFTLGSPHAGTLQARFGRAPSVRQMRVDSPWLRALAASEVDGDRGLPRAAYTTIFSWHDDIVYPQTTGALDGAEVVAIGGCGHVALLYDRRVRTIVFARLDALETGASDAQASAARAT